MEERKGNIVQTAIDAGTRLAELQEIPEGKYPLTRFMVPEGMVVNEIPTQTSPARKSGNKVFTSAKSFCEYVNKHKKEGETVIIANEDVGKIEVIFNDHNPESPGFGDFRAILNLGFSKQFKTWFEKSFNCNESNKHSQAYFADFIEDHRTDLMIGDIEKEGQTIKNLSGLELSDLINNLQISSEVNVKAKRSPHDDQMHYEYEVKDSGKCEFALPKSIFLATPVYKYGDIFRIELRLRSSGRSGEPKFWYIIDQLDALKEKAFDKICKRIKEGNKGSEVDPDEQFEGTGLEVWKGNV
jgi:uncharacterized protein YfdQ (DUF2303 family)